MTVPLLPGQRGIWLLLATSLALPFPVESQPRSTDRRRPRAVRRPVVVVLPPTSDADVPPRARTRVGEALGRVAKADPGGVTLLTATKLSACDNDPKCRLRLARAAGGDRAVETHLAHGDEELMVRARVRDVRTHSDLLERSVSVSGVRSLLPKVGALFKGVLAEARLPRAALLAKKRELAVRAAVRANPVLPIAQNTVRDTPAQEPRGRPASQVSERARVARRRSRWSGRRLAAPRPAKRGRPLPGTRAGDLLEKRGQKKKKKKGADWLAGLARMGDGARRAPSSWAKRFERVAAANAPTGRRAAITAHAGWGALAFTWGFAGIGPALAWANAWRRRRRDDREGPAAKARELIQRCCERMTPGLLMSTEFETVRHFHFAALEDDELTVRVSDHDAAEAHAYHQGSMLCLQFSYGDRSVFGMATVVGATEAGALLRVVMRPPDHLADIVLPNSFCVPVPAHLTLRARIVQDDSAAAQPADPPTELESFVTEIGSRVLRIAGTEDVVPLTRDRTLDVQLSLDGAEAVAVRARYVGAENEVLTLRLVSGAEDATSLGAYEGLFRQVQGAWVAPTAASDSVGPTAPSVTAPPVTQSAPVSKAPGEMSERVPVGAVSGVPQVRIYRPGQDDQEKAG